MNGKGETALHAVCFSGGPNTLYYLVASGVDPQTVTTEGHSALTYAVICEECPQKMVAAWIKLGFCTYQPQINKNVLKENRVLLTLPFATDPARRPKLFLSPVLLAVFRGLPVVTRMLYESGSCSNTELFKLCTYRQGVIHITGFPSKYISLCGAYAREAVSVLVRTAGNCIAKCADNFVTAAVVYLMNVCSTPRSLKSSCRLVISRCVTVCHQRHRNATYAQLPLTEELRNYVMFSDLTDPDYGQDETEGDEKDTHDNSYYNRSRFHSEFFSFGEHSVW